MGVEHFVGYRNYCRGQDHLSHHGRLIQMAEKSFVQEYRNCVGSEKVSLFRAENFDHFRYC